MSTGTGRQFSIQAFRWQLEADANPDVVASNRKAVTDAMRERDISRSQDMTNIRFGNLYRSVQPSILSLFPSVFLALVRGTGRTPVRELGLGLWRDIVVRSNNIRLRLVEAVRLAKGREEEDGVVDVPGARDLVAGVTEMLTELGAHVCREVMDAPTVSS